MRALFLTASSLALLAATATAGVNVEHGMAYEETFLEACAEGATARTCRCVMERVEEKISFVAFAEEVDRHGLRIMTANSIAPAIESAQRFCNAQAAAVN
ncbi:MAG: hypothetical protein JNK67_31630 [Alphaproteobacteria bacterium]|nr:hypothetical protein [Alphaproteobacteria bacterium]